MAMKLMLKMIRFEMRRRESAKWLDDDLSLPAASWAG